MKINRSDINRLKSERRKRFKNSVKSLLDGKTDFAKENIEWINLSTELISKSTERRYFQWALIIGVVCLIIISLGFTMHVRTSQVSIEIIASGVSFSFSEDWRSEQPLIGDTFYINKVKTVHSSLIPQIYHSSQPGTLELSGNNIELKNLSFSKLGYIEIQKQRDNLILDVKNSHVSGRFSLRTGIITINDDLDTLHIPERRPKLVYTFQTDSVTGIADNVHLDIGNLEKLDMNNLNISEVMFQMENPPGSGRFESTIHHGNIHLFDTKEEINILENEKLFIKAVDCRQTSLYLTDNKIGFKFIGTINRLSGGFQNISKDYKPTYLEYFYHNQQLALFWSALVFLFGIIWSIKNSLFR
ncbi:hypothetical protein GF337_01865 [candidate division KSB1 bacterium]|nr:hypothetical protein [candidate division KSB1 bacterium]